MRRIAVGVAVLGLLVTGGRRLASADDLPVIKQIAVDENGNLVVRTQVSGPDKFTVYNTANNNSLAIPLSDTGLPGALGVPVLAYDVTSLHLQNYQLGDLVMNEKGGPVTINSDVIRFVPKGTTGSPDGSKDLLVFYSDNSDTDTGGSPPADTGLPSALFANHVEKNEDAAESAEDIHGNKVEYQPKDQKNGPHHTVIPAEPGFFGGPKDEGFKWVFFSEGSALSVLPGPTPGPPSPNPEPATFVIYGVLLALAAAAVRYSRRRAH